MISIIDVEHIKDGILVAMVQSISSRLFRVLTLSGTCDHRKVLLSLVVQLSSELLNGVVLQHSHADRTTSQAS